MPQTVQVAVDRATIHFDKLYTYRLPQDRPLEVHHGSMVLVPFGRANKPRMGVVLGVDQEAPDQAQKELLDAAPGEARLTPDLLSLVLWLKEETFCTYYEAVKAVIPYGAQYRPTLEEGKPRLQCGTRLPTQLVYSLKGKLPEKPKPGPKQLAAVKLLEEGPLSAKALEEKGISREVANNLWKKGVLEREEVSEVPDLYTNIPYRPEEIALTAEQKGVAQGLAQLLDRKPHAALLYGVTGSGKTLVFLNLIQQTLALGRKVLVMVPEIGLTPQMILRLKSQFGSRVAVQHSALNHTERLAQWRMIQQGGADIVVGTRSAVFAPLDDIGLIIIDEEQEHTYHSESSPRFAARDVAKFRAAQQGSLLLFASATPSVDTFYWAKEGRYSLFRLTQRYGGHPLPQVEMVDMRQELAAGNAGEISLELAQQLQENLDRGRQSILLLNRRGYRTLATCSQCREVVKCHSCSVPMVYHKDKNQLVCHYCGSVISPAPRECPSCGGELRYTGFGTQRVEEELARLLPKARILRMDQDTTGKKNAHETMFSRFSAGEYDIMVGTQMVAKGLDFPKVTLVGVLGIDNLLFGQSYRAYENVFSLVTQVVGRGGRADLPGRALIQTSVPDHPVLNLAAQQDYEAFYEPEAELRRRFLYPPFCSLCTMGFVGEKEDRVRDAAQSFASILGQLAGQNPEIPLRILRPAPMSIAMLKDQYRYRLIIKCRNGKKFRELLRQALAEYDTRKLSGWASVSIDFYSDND